MNQTSVPTEASLYRDVVKFQNPTVRGSVWQIVNSALPYLALLPVMYWSLTEF